MDYDIQCTFPQLFYLMDYKDRTHNNKFHFLLTSSFHLKRPTKTLPCPREFSLYALDPSSSLYGIKKLNLLNNCLYFVKIQLSQDLQESLTFRIHQRFVIKH